MPHGDLGFPLENQYALVEFAAVKGKASSKKKTRSLGVKLKVLRSSISEVGNTAWTDNYLSEKLMGRMRELAKDCGQSAPKEEWSNPVADFDTDDPGDSAFMSWCDGFKGVKLLCKIRKEEQDGYDDKNSIGAFEAATEDNLAKWDKRFKYPNKEEASSGGF